MVHHIQQPNKGSFKNFAVGYIFFSVIMGIVFGLIAMDLFYGVACTSILLLFGTLCLATCIFLAVIYVPPIMFVNWLIVINNHDDVWEYDSIPAINPKDDWTVTVTENGNILFYTDHKSKHTIIKPKNNRDSRE